ncbi:MAG: zonular occludens toxin domain-containing protein [Eikenella sp.]|nr:zonular occludens toxin domain-containing protein [Eikenella sp.]
MITLITGTPGSGKTLYMVSQLAKSKEFEGRKIFVDGIRDLQIPTEPIPEGHSIADMHVWLQQPENHGSVVVIDEAQRVFPPRSAGSRAPENVEFLHVHRHYGIDVFLITQMPKRIDANVRDLVGAHYHIYKNKLGLRTKFYWDYCATNPKAESRNGQASVYKLDSDAYSLYKSAEIHTKIKQPKTRWLYAAAVAALCAPGALYWAYSVLSGGGGMVQAESVTESTSDSGVKAGIDNAAAGLAGTGQQSLTAEMFVPTLAERPESKPLYDTVRQVKSYERVAACIKGGKTGCTCYSDQATPLREISQELCTDYAENGLPFDPFRQPRQDNTPAVSADSAPAIGAQVSVLDGQPQKNLAYSDDAPRSAQYP